MVIELADGVDAAAILARLQGLVVLVSGPQLKEVRLEVVKAVIDPDGALHGYPNSKETGESSIGATITTKVSEIRSIEVL